MSIFGHKDQNSKLALAKQEAVFSLWEIQTDGQKMLIRGIQSKCITEAEVQDLMQKINLERQKIQDSFLLCSSLNKVQEYIENCKNQFQEIVKMYVEQIISREHSLEPEVRIKNINDNFQSQFNQLYQGRKIEKETRHYLESQLELFSNALRKNLAENQLRPNIKSILLHELIDDYYQEVNQIYLQAISKQKGIKDNVS